MRRKHDPRDGREEYGLLRYGSRDVHEPIIARPGGSRELALGHQTFELRIDRMQGIGGVTKLDVCRIPANRLVVLEHHHSAQLVEWRLRAGLPNRIIEIRRDDGARRGTDSP